jgi:hypothetical protein
MDNHSRTFHVALPATFTTVVHNYGFNTLNHFFQQCALALIKANDAGQKLEWPLELATRRTRK